MFSDDEILEMDAYLKRLDSIATGYLGEYEHEKLVRLFEAQDTHSLNDRIASLRLDLLKKRSDIKDEYSLKMVATGLLTGLCFAGRIPRGDASFVKDVVGCASAAGCGYLLRRFNEKKSKITRWLDVLETVQPRPSSTR